MEEHDLKNTNNFMNANIYSYLEMSVAQSSNLYLNVVHFSTLVSIRHLWQLKTVVFMYCCLIHAALWAFGILTLDQLSQHQKFLLRILIKIP